jgi:hypothetical protein
MSLFLCTIRFRPYVDRRWSALGSKDMTGNPIQNTFLFLLECFFFRLTNTRTNTYLTVRMPSPLRQVACECGDCATTNRGREQLPCSYCRAENPRRYEILAGSAPAATARTTYVMRPEQHDIVRVLSEPRVVFVPRPVMDRALLAERLKETMIDIVGMETAENGRSCHAHEVCGAQLDPGSKVRIRKETYISPTTRDEEDCLVAYVVGNGVMTCKVGYLPRHLSIRRADDYDGMYAHVVEVYSARSVNITKLQKRHRNLGCCVATILGNAPVRSL